MDHTGSSTLSLRTATRVQSDTLSLTLQPTAPWAPIHLSPPSSALTRSFATHFVVFDGPPLGAASQRLLPRLVLRHRVEGQHAAAGTRGLGGGEGRGGEGGCGDDADAEIHT